MTVRRILPLLGFLLACSVAAWGAITIAPSGLPNGAVTGAYSAQLTATGAVNAITWSLSSGAPPGLALSAVPGNAAAENLSGTLTTAGDYTFTVTATASSVSGSQQYTVHVIGISSPATLPGGTVGIPYSQALTVAGAVAPVTWSHQTAPLPPGLTLNSDGTITGTPTAVGTYSFVAVVVDNSDNQTTSTLSITVGAASITPTTLSGGTVGNTFSPVQLTLNPPGSGITWSVTSGALPTGLALSSAGVVSGQFTNAAGSPFSFTITARSGQIVVASQQYSVIVSGSSTLPQLDPNSLSFSAPVGVAFSAQLNGTGGTPPYAYAVNFISGAANAFAVSSTGAVTGTPTVVGATTVNVTITDSGLLHLSSSGNVVINVINNGALTITTTSPITTGAINTPFSLQLTASGGTTPYTWTLNSGSSLPAGLTLSAAGVISGSTAVAGSTTFNVTVTDAASPAHTATAALTLVIASSSTLTITTTSPLTPGTVGVAYSATLQATGGTTPYAWSATSLPGGLSLSSGGVLSGTPTATGTTVINVTVTDAASSAHTATAALTIVIGTTALRVTTASPLPAGTIGTAYTALQLTASGGTPPLTWTASGLPPGFTLSAAGVLTGIPTAAGTTSFSVTVTDSTSATATATLSLTVNALPLSITTTSPINAGGVGIPYSKTFTATGGVSPYTWTASSLPAGLTMSATGVLSGTPTVATTNTFFVTVTDSASTSVNGTFTLVISTPTLTVTTSVPVSCFVATKGRAFPDPEIPGTSSGTTCPNPGTSQDVYQFTATGGTAPYAFSLAVPGTLPPGMTLFSNGTLSGTPTSAGSYTFTAVATDSMQALGSLAETIVVGTVGQPASVNIILGGSTSSTIPAAQQPAVVLSLGGTPFPYTVFGTVTVSFASGVGGINSLVTFSNGTPTTTFSIPANTNNAIVNNGNVLTGTQAGTLTLTATQFTDRYGNVLTPLSNSPVTYTIAAGPPVITNVSVSSNPAPTPSAFTLTVTGYSTTRDMTSAAFTFTAPSTDTLASSTFTVPLTGPFTTWYSDSRSNPFGSTFVMTIQFSVASSGSTVTKPITGVTLTMTNSKGTSNASGSVNPYP